MKILILGIGGMIGHQIWTESLKNIKLNVFGIVNKNLDKLKILEIFNNNLSNIVEGIDCSNFDNLIPVFEKINPDVIINAVGITIRKKEIENISYVYEVNSLMPHKIQKWCELNNKRMIHLSTDCVFDGGLGNYTEKSIGSAKDTYGKSKFVGEVSGNNAVTLRFSCIGRELLAKTELLEWCLSQKSKTIKGFSRVIYTGVTSKIIALEVIRVILEFKELSGLYQISGPAISKYELLNKINRIYNLNIVIEESIDYCSNKSLNSSKYSLATGFICPSWDEMLENMAANNTIDYEMIQSLI